MRPEHWLFTIPLRLRSLFRWAQADRELDDELRDHLERKTEEYVSQGMTSEEARRRARIDLDGIEQTKEKCRDARRVNWTQDFVQDLHFGLRMLRKSPGFTAVAVVTLALGIGASTSVFSVVDRILFRSLPYPEANRLVSFGLLAPIERDEFMLGSGYVDFRKQPGPFESVAAMAPGTTGCDLTEQNAVRLDCALVEQSFLPTLGIQPILGRNFLAEEDRPNAPRVALLTYSLFKSRFAGDPNVLGKTISLDGSATRIVGVLPSNFEMPALNAVDILLPLALDEDQQRHANPGMVLRTFARLKPGINVSQAAASIQPWFQQALQGAPPVFRKEIRLSVRTLRERQTQDARLTSWLLFGAVLAFLLVACTNVANFLLARATSRQRELAVRAALGAGRGRLVRQTLTESLLLGVLGGTLGSWFAYLLLRSFLFIAPQGIPRLEQARIDARVAAFALGVTLFSAVIFGLVPALQYPTPEFLMGKEVRGTTRHILRHLLVTAQIAISLTLLAGASLLLRSLWNLEEVQLGMQTENVLTESISLAPYRYPSLEKQLAFFAELEERIKHLPGVTSVAWSDSLPPYGHMRSTIFAAIEVAGRPLFSEGTGGSVGWRVVTPAYFSALAIPIIQGRPFQESDLSPSENPIILNETLARELFPNSNPLGQQLRLFRIPGPWCTVVGIAANVKNNGLTTHADPEFYLPWKKDLPVDSFRSAYLTVRTQMPPKPVVAWLRAETRGLDSALPVSIEAMSRRVGKLTARPRFEAVLLSLFAGMAALLAAIGIYGVVLSLVEQRTHEIGVRMALGASPQGISRMVLANTGRWTISGAAVGLLGTWLCGRLLQSLLFQVRAHDPALLGVALALLMVVAFAAAWAPARRASRVDPMVALRHE
jgi:putative ABC transport system permease protein